MTADKNNPIEASAHWGVAYHTNSSNPRAKKWYYLARLVKTDGKWFEIYRLGTDEISSGGNNEKEFRKDALERGYALLHGVFRPAPAPRLLNEMIWSLDKKGRNGRTKKLS